MIEKRSKKESEINFYVNAVNSIKACKSLAQVCSKLGISKQALNYQIKPLKVSGVLIKRGYGVWEINESKLEEFLKEVKNSKKSIAVTKDRLSAASKKNDIRGHGFRIKLYIPKIPNWLKRREYLVKKNITFKPIGVGWKGESILLGEDKVWLTDNSIIFHLNNSFLADSADHSRKHALYEFRCKIRQLENLLDVSFEIKKRYEFKVIKQHYAHMKDAIAEQYNKEGKKLNVYADDYSLRFLIDNSFNLNELEAVNRKTAHRDMDNVKPFLNSLADRPFVSDDVHKAKDDISEIRGVLREIVDIQKTESTKMAFYAENIKSHTESIIKLGNGIDKFSDKIDQLGINQVSLPSRQVVRGYDPKIIIRKVNILADVLVLKKEIAAMTDEQREEFQRLLADKFN